MTFTVDCDTGSTATDWVGIFPAGPPTPSTYVLWQYVTTCTGTAVWTGGLADGHWTAWYLKNEGYDQYGSFDFRVCASLPCPYIGNENAAVNGALNTFEITLVGSDQFLPGVASDASMALSLLGSIANDQGVYGWPLVLAAYVDDGNAHTYVTLLNSDRTAKISTIGSPAFYIPADETWSLGTIPQSLLVQGSSKNENGDITSSAANANGPVVIENQGLENVSQHPPRQQKYKLLKTCTLKTHTKTRWRPNLPQCRLHPGESGCVGLLVHRLQVGITRELARCRSCGRRGH
jgi:hypothetical protein